MTDVPLPLPDEFPWGYLTGRVIRVLPMDTIDDEDRIPEARGASGQITLTPKNRAATAGTNLVVHEGATLDIDNQGYLVNAHGEREPIAVVVGRYAVSFKLNSGQIQGYDIEITTNHTQEAPLQLASAAPQPIPTTGVTTMVVPTGAFEGGYLGYLDGSLAWITGSGSGGEGTAGPAGASAYELAVQEGFVGTLSEWLESLRGVDGQDGINGIDGEPGRDGIDGVQGERGEQGPPGPGVVVLNPTDPDPDPVLPGVLYVRLADSEVPTGSAPVITVHPESASVAEGSRVEFNAEATGDPSPTMVWESNSSGSWLPLASTTSPLVIETASLALTGSAYRAVFTNDNGTATSDAASLTVTEEPVDPTPGTLEFSDDFNRADGPAGNGWFMDTGSGTASIVSQALQVTGGSGYQRLAHPSHPTRSRLEVDLLSVLSDSQYTGLFIGRDASHEGVKLFRNTSTNDLVLVTADSATVSGGETITGSYAAFNHPNARWGLGWDGTSITVWLDGEQFYSTSTPALVSLLATGATATLGMCGTSGKNWDNVEVYSL